MKREREQCGRWTFSITARIIPEYVITTQTLPKVITLSLVIKLKHPKQPQHRHRKGAGI